jgi:hypothetical protein
LGSSSLTALVQIDLRFLQQAGGLMCCTCCCLRKLASAPCRVQLSNEGPYINASLVQLQVPHLPQACSYIATQGPLPHTTSHFWQMVMDNEVRPSSPAAAATLNAASTGQVNGSIPERHGTWQPLRHTTQQQQQQRCISFCLWQLALIAKQLDQGQGGATARWHDTMW